MAPILQIQIKRDTEANILASSMAVGEIGLATDTSTVWAWNGLLKSVVGKAIVDVAANIGNYSGSPGRFFFASDTGALYVYTGSAWLACTATATAPSISATVNFGFASGKQGDDAVVTVTGCSWVTSNSKITCSLAAVTTPDHDPEDPVIEGLTAYAANLVPGVGFDIYCYAPNGTWGRYTVNAIGA